MPHRVDGQAVRHDIEMIRWLATLSKAGMSLWQDSGIVRHHVPHGAVFPAQMLEQIRQRLRCLPASSSLLTRDNDCLVHLAISDRRDASIICVHAAHGDVFDYQYLAAAVAAEYPVYALQALRLLLAERTPDSIEQIAGLYARELLQNQLCDQPFALYGGSAGGVVALEIAHQLTAAGKQPAVLILGDTQHALVPALATSTELPERYLWMSFVSACMPRELLDVIGVGAHEFWISLAHEERISYVLDAVASLHAATYLVPLRRDCIARHLAIQAHFLYLYGRYGLKPYAGNSVYVKAARVDWDRSRTLREALTGRTRVVEIAGTHLSLMRADGAATVARIAESELQRSIGGSVQNQ